METLIERLDKLKVDGYTDNLSVAKQSLYSQNDVKLPKENLKIDCVYRIEDDSDPTHQTVIYALTCSQPPVKGVLINSFGPYSEENKDQFIESLSKSP